MLLGYHCRDMACHVCNVHDCGFTWTWRAMSAIPIPPPEGGMVYYHPSFWNFSPVACSRAVASFPGTGIRRNLSEVAL